MSYFPTPWEREVIRQLPAPARELKVDRRAERYAILGKLLEAGLVDYDRVQRLWVLTTEGRNLLERLK